MTCFGNHTLTRYNVTLVIPPTGLCNPNGADGTCQSLVGGFLGQPPNSYGSDGAVPTEFGAAAISPVTLHDYDQNCNDNPVLFDEGFAGESFIGFDLTWIQYDPPCSNYTHIGIFRARVYNVVFPLLPHDPMYGQYTYAHHLIASFDFIGRWATEPGCVSNPKFTLNAGLSRNRYCSNDPTKIPCCTVWRGAYDLAAGVTGSDGNCSPKNARWIAEPVPCASLHQGAEGNLAYPMPVGYPEPGVIIWR